MATTNNYKLKEEAIKDLYQKELEGNWEPLKDLFDIHPKSPGGCTMGDVNHCVISGVMSVCSATNLRIKEDKLNTQEKCKYFIKASYEQRCMWETFEEYCWSIKAQSAASKGK